jgi:hypothetical protein
VLLRSCAALAVKLAGPVLDAAQVAAITARQQEGDVSPGG